MADIAEAPVTSEAAPVVDTTDNSDDNFVDGPASSEAPPTKSPYVTDFADDPDADTPDTSGSTFEKPPELPKVDEWETISRDQAANLLAVAEQMGVSRDAAKSFTPAGLESHLRQRISILTQQQRQQQAPVPQFKLDLGELEQELHPQLLQNIKGMHAHYEGQIQQQQQYIQQVHQYLQAQAYQQRNRELEASTERFESRIKTLDPMYQKLLGKGSIYDMTEGSANRQNRLKLFQKMQAMTPQNGLPPGGEERLFQEALAACFVGEIPELTKQKLSEELRERKQTTTARPTHRETKPRSGDSAAVSASRSFDKKFGLE